MTATRAQALADRQLELDREATRRFPALGARKQGRLLASPHAFLRGSAPLFYEVLAATPALAEGPAGEGWIVGDMHLENMGAYKADEPHEMSESAKPDTKRTEAHATKGSKGHAAAHPVTFDLNDFDDAAIGPLRYDVLRLLASTLLSARALGAPAVPALDAAARLADAYVEALFAKATSRPGSGSSAPLPKALAELVAAATNRSKKALLDARAPEVHGLRRFVRGERYHDLSPSEIALAWTLLPEYVQALGPRAPSRAASWRIVDAAQRVAGTGSLGRLRLAVLVMDDAGEERVLDFKEAAPSSVERGPGRAAEKESPLDAAHRVVAAARALVLRPPRLLAAVRAPSTGSSFVARQLCPQEDKLEVARAGLASLREVAAHGGAVLGRAHARAAKALPPRPWSKDDVRDLLERAIELAGLYEATYLAYAHRAPAE